MNSPTNLAPRARAVAPVLHRLHGAGVHVRSVCLYDVGSIDVQLEDSRDLVIAEADFDTDISIRCPRIGNNYASASITLTAGGYQVNLWTSRVPEIAGVAS